MSNEEMLLELSSLFLLFLLIDVFTYGIFIDPNWTAEVLGFMSHYYHHPHFTDNVREVWWIAQDHANSSWDFYRSWDLNSDIVVQNSLVENAPECTLLPVVRPDSMVWWRPKSRELRNHPQEWIFWTNHTSVEERMIYQGLHPSGCTQFQKICEKLFLCCLLSCGFHETGCPQAWRNVAFQLDKGESFSPG